MLAPLIPLSAWCTQIFGFVNPRTAFKWAASADLAKLQEPLKLKQSRFNFNCNVYVFLLIFEIFLLFLPTELKLVVLGAPIIATDLCRSWTAVYIVFLYQSIPQCDSHSPPSHALTTHSHKFMHVKMRVCTIWIGDQCVQHVYIEFKIMACSSNSACNFRKGSEFTT